jgi:hypothetical protein
MYDLPSQVSIMPNQLFQKRLIEIEYPPMTTHTGTLETSKYQDVHPTIPWYTKNKHEWHESSQLNHGLEEEHLLSPLTCLDPCTVESNSPGTTSTAMLVHMPDYINNINMPTPPSSYKMLHKKHAPSSLHCFHSGGWWPTHTHLNH